MSTTKQVQVRISAQGGKQLKAELKDIGTEGSRAFKQVGDSARAQTAQVQAAAYQVGDFFVQWGAGTDPMRAAAQQLPQLLGGLGMLGAVAGAVVAAGVPLVRMFMDMGDTAIPAEEAVKNLVQAVDALDAATKAANAGPDELMAKYGRGYAQAKEALEIQRQIAKIEAEQALSTASASMGAGAVDVGAGTRGMGSELAAARVEYEALSREIEAFGEIRDANDQAAWDSLQQRRTALDQTFIATQNYRDEMIAFADGLGLVFEGNEEALQGVNNAMLDLAAANGLEEQSAAAAVLRQALRDASDDGKLLNQEGRDLAKNLSDAELKAYALAQIDLASGVAAAASSAAALAHDLGVSVALASQMMGAGYTGGKKPVIFDPRDPNYDQAAATAARLAEEAGRVSPFDPSRIPKVSTKGGSSAKSGGTGGGADPLTKEAEKWFNQTRTAAEKYADELAELDKLQAAAKISADTYTRSVVMIGEKYLDIGDASDFWKDVNADLKDSFLDLAVDGEESFDAIERSIKRAALEAIAFKTGPLASMFGGAGGGGGGGFGAFLSGLLSFEGGGYTGSGARSGGMDGRGGFLAMLHPEEDVYDRRKGGPGPGRTQVEVVPSKYFDVRVAEVSTTFDRQAARAQRRVMPGLMRDAQARGLG